jgi:hypothetical protein
MPRLHNNILEKAVGGWTVGLKLFAYTGRPFSVTNCQLGGQIAATFSGTILADLLDPTALGKHCTGAAWTTPCLTQSQFFVTTTAWWARDNDGVESASVAVIGISLRQIRTDTRRVVT